MTTVATVDADEILARMRDDRESDWSYRLLAAVHRREWQPLSPRELLSLQLASHGMRRRECAVLMGVEPLTVAYFWLVARRKLKAKNTAHAVALAIRAGLIV